MHNLLMCSIMWQTWKQKLLAVTRKYVLTNDILIEHRQQRDAIISSYQYSDYVIILLSKLHIHGIYCIKEKFSWHCYSFLLVIIIVYEHM